MERSEGDKPEQTDARRASDQITLPPPPTPAERARIFAEAAADVQADNDRRPRRHMDFAGAAEPKKQDKWDDAETTSKRIDVLKNEGHGPQRHVEVDDGNLLDRLGTPARDASGEPEINGSTGHIKKVRGTQIDPATGTTTDYDTGKPHYCGPYATRFNDPADYARADEILRTRAETTGDLDQRENIVVLFPQGDANERFTGFYQDVAKPENADGTARFKEVDFTGGRVLARYTENGDGSLSLKTMFPDPDRSNNT